MRRLRFFADLDIGDSFRFKQRPTLLCKKTGLEKYTMEPVPAEYEGKDFNVFGEPMIRREAK